VQEILSMGHLHHAEQQQQICSADEQKTNMQVSIFPAVEQQLYFQEFFLESEILPTT
jgi:hypothetical protein